MLFRSPVYHYHSNYDSYHWMTTYGDPNFRTHKVMGQYLTLLTYNLATQDIRSDTRPRFICRVSERGFLD